MTNETRDLSVAQSNLLRPIQFAESISAKMNDCWYYGAALKQPATTNRIRFNSGSYNSTVTINGANQPMSIMNMVIGRQYNTLHLGTATVANWVTMGQTTINVSATVLTVDVKYIVTTLGTTNNAAWLALATGLTGTVVVGTIFTANGSAVPAGTGTVFAQIFTNTTAAVVTSGVNTIGTVSDVALFTPTFTQREVELNTYQASIQVTNELFADATTQLMDYWSRTLADSICHQICIAEITRVIGLTSDLSRRGAIAVTAGTTGYQQLMNLVYLRFQPIARRRLNWVASPTTVAAFASLSGTPTPPGNALPFVADVDGDSIWGKPVRTSEAMPTYISATGGLTVPHWLAIDMERVVIYEQPLVVTVDTQSMLGTNTTVIHAIKRATGTVLDSEAFGYLSLHTS